jgi:PIN domain nuclease of toxin-antitoxin system
MKLLLDTVTFLDSALASKDLSTHAKNLMLDPENELHVSIVSVWEIAIKYSSGKLQLPDSPERFIPEHRSKLDADILTLDEESVLHLLRLPRLHRDPFDRMLIGQAVVHGMVILTPDTRIGEYPVRTAW